MPHTIFKTLGPHAVALWCIPVLVDGAPCRNSRGVGLITCVSFVTAGAIGRIEFANTINPTSRLHHSSHLCHYMYCLPVNFMIAQVPRDSEVFMNPPRRHSQLPDAKDRSGVAASIPLSVVNNPLSRSAFLSSAAAIFAMTMLIDN